MFTSGENDYREWRAERLALYPGCARELMVDIGGLKDVSEQGRTGILESCARANMAIYTCRDRIADRAAVRTFGENFGLRRLDHHLCANDDGVSELAVSTGGRKGEYVPYSNRGLSWHTDGYYNRAAEQIHAVILHCAQAASSGGESAVLDPHIAYIKMRDADAAYIEAFEHPACMEIPANVGDQGEIRPAVCGPVFSYGESGTTLHMRYTTRRKNVRWRDDPATTAARQFLSELLEDETGPVLRFRLQPGQGIISNNVLHNRTAFEDDSRQQRLLYRARYFERIDSS